MAKKKQNQKKNETKITQPKGRPMLSWVGKKPLDYIKSFPAQIMEVYNPLKTTEPLENPSFNELEKNWQNLLFHGDNKEVLGYLLNNGFRGKVDLIYIDPPFDSGANYLRKVDLRSMPNTNRIEGEEYTVLEQMQYHDIWNNDGYLQYLFERLLLMKELLSEKGSIFVHCDWHKEHYIKLILDEIFGEQRFKNQIIWKRTSSHSDTKNKLSVNTDTILYYSKDEEPIFNYIYQDYSESYISQFYKYKDNDGRIYRISDLCSPNPRPNLYYEYKGYLPNKNGWAVSKEQMEKLDKQNRLVFPKKKDGRIMRKTYLDERKGVVLGNVWDDINPVQPFSKDRTNYPTQKPTELMERIIEISTKSDSLIFDCFIGSGTTAAVAQKLGRRWIGCDINKGSIQTTSKRLQDIVSNQISELKKKDEELFKEEEVNKHFSFATYKVNDYDLQLLHTEAIELAAEHIGIKKTKTDKFFDGLHGKNLVKIIDFNHPLSLYDLQLIQDELKKRPDEDRNITVVCLGKELGVDKWIEDHNRKQPQNMNRIKVIELRTDSKYGKFLIHKPCEAKVNFKKEKDKVHIEIEDFISPTILERLNIDDESIFRVKIPDFRSMIDVVLIDNNYNGKVFNIALSDVPEKKNDLIEGKYEIELPKKKEPTIAVKIIDMLGEELLITKEFKTQKRKK